VFGGRTIGEIGLALVIPRSDYFLNAVDPLMFWLRFGGQILLERRYADTPFQSSDADKVAKASLLSGEVKFSDGGLSPTESGTKSAI